MIMKRVFAFTLLAVLGTLSMAAQSNFDRAKEAAGVRDYLEAVTYIRPAVREEPRDEETLALATKIYLELDLLDSAEIYGERLYDIEDEVPEWVHDYALALTRNGKATRAIEILRALDKENPDVQTSLYLVNALLEADSTQAAELVAATAKKKYPDNADAYLSMGLLYFNYKPQPVYELAVQNFEKAAELDENLVRAHFGLAECYWKMANRESDDDLANELFKRSLVEWNAVGRLDPRNARAWFEQGKIFYLAKKYLESVKALIRYRELRPVGTGQSIASWYLGKSYYELQLCDSAKIHLDDAASEIDSLKPKATLMLARCSFLSKNWADAASQYQAAVKGGTSSRDWESIDVWYYGAACVLAGDTVRAIAVMTEAAERDPKQCSFMFRFGLLLQSRQMSATSNRIFRQRLENCSDSLDPKIYMLIGNNFFADSLVDSAIASYERSLKLDPTNGYVQTRLAETYMVQGDEAKARALYGEVIANGEIEGASDDDKRAAISAILKVNGIDIKAKDWKGIIDRSKRGLEIDGENRWLRLYTAIGYQGQGDLENACKWYRQVLKVDPENSTAKKNLQALGC